MPYSGNQLLKRVDRNELARFLSHLERSQQLLDGRPTQDRVATKIAYARRDVLDDKGLSAAREDLRNVSFLILAGTPPRCAFHQFLPPFIEAAILIVNR